MAEEKIYTLAEIYDQIGQETYRQSWNYESIGCLVLEGAAPVYVQNDNKFEKINNVNLKTQAQKIKDIMLNMIIDGAGIDVWYFGKNDNIKRPLNRHLGVTDIYIPSSYLILDREKNFGWVKCEVHEEENFLSPIQHEGRVPKWDWTEIHLKIQECLYQADKSSWSIRQIAKFVRHSMKGQQKQNKTETGNEDSMPDLREVEKAVSKFYNLKTQNKKS